jgi:hypothetical protein
MDTNVIKHGDIRRTRMSGELCLTLPADYGKYDGWWLIDA